MHHSNYEVIDKQSCSSFCTRLVKSKLYQTAKLDFEIGRENKHLVINFAYSYCFLYLTFLPKSSAKSSEFFSLVCATDSDENSFIILTPGAIKNHSFVTRKMDKFYSKQMKVTDNNRDINHHVICQLWGPY